MIHIITGLPGSGKSEVSWFLEQLLDAYVISTDSLRDQLYPDRATNEHNDFTAEQLTVIYQVIPVVAYHLARLDPTRHIIFEGTFRSRHHRQMLIDMMVQANITLSMLWVKASPEAVAKRITARHIAGKHLAKIETYLAVATVYEAPDEACIVNNNGSLEELAQAVVVYCNSLPHPSAASSDVTRD